MIFVSKVHRSPSKPSLEPSPLEAKGGSGWCRPLASGQATNHHRAFCQGDILLRGFSAGRRQHAETNLGCALRHCLRRRRTTLRLSCATKGHKWVFQSAGLVRTTGHRVFKRSRILHVEYSTHPISRTSIDAQRVSSEAGRSRKPKRLAADYQKRGYIVVTHPSQEDLPSFFGSYQPDLIASKGDEHIAVEVKTSATLSSTGELASVANNLSQQPGWRLEFVVTNPPSHEVAEPVAELSSLMERLSTAQKLLASNEHEAAVLIGWAAAEGAMRRVADAENVPISSSIAVVKELRSRGLLEPDEYKNLEVV